MRNIGFFVTAALIVAVLSGCSPSRQEAPAVASVSKAPGTAASSSAAQSGPRARLDTTAQEKTRWSRIYWQCMKDHGARVDDTEKAKNIGFVDPSQASPEIFAACASKKPTFVPPEMDPALNPDYKQQWHEAVTCMQRRGMPIVETEDGWNFDSSNAAIPADQDQIERECQIEAFGKK